MPSQCGYGRLAVLFTRSDYIKISSENNGSKMPSSAIPLGHIAIDSGAEILPAACTVFCKSKSVKKASADVFCLKGGPACA